MLANNGQLLVAIFSWLGFVAAAFFEGWRRRRVFEKKKAKRARNNVQAMVAQNTEEPEGTSGGNRNEDGLEVVDEGSEGIYDVLEGRLDAWAVDWTPPDCLAIWENAREEVYDNAQ